MSVKNILCIGIMLASVLSVHAQDPVVSDAQNEHSQVLDSKSAFYCAAHALVSMRLGSGRDNVLAAIMRAGRDVSVELREDIINNNKINLSPVADHLVSLSYCGFAKAKVEEPERFDCAVRYHAVNDFWEIQLYRFIYKMTFEKVMHCDSNSEEILLFKNILTPREFGEAHHWIQTESDIVDLSMFPISMKNVLMIVNQSSFEEAFICLMLHGFRFKDEHDALQMSFFSGVDLSSQEAVLSINQRIRSVIEQQGLPERRALTRLLHTDQEVANGYNNSKLLSEGLTISSKKFSKQDANAS
jgi:hypothetical protein